MKSLFLHGYGLSIKVKNTRMVFSQGIDPFSDKRKTFELPATACNFDKVVIQGRDIFFLKVFLRCENSEF